MARAAIWFTLGYAANQILHELAHALTAQALGVPSTLYQFWVSIDFGGASPDQRAIIALSGPLTCGVAGAVCWWLAHGRQRASLSLPMIYLAAFGLIIGAANFAAAAFVGDVANATLALGVPTFVRLALTVSGAAALVGTMWMVGRKLGSFSQVGVSRVASAVRLVLVPAVVGTILLIAVNLPVPNTASFVAARLSEALIWIVAALGVATAAPQMTQAHGELQLRWSDAVWAGAVVVVIRILVSGVHFHG